MNREDLKAIKELLKEELEPIKNELAELGPVKEQLNKNTIILEEIKSDIKTIVEVQKSHMDQNEKAHTEVVKPLTEKIDVIELAVKDISKDAKELKEKFDKVEKVTIQNTYDVAYLKSIK